MWFTLSYAVTVSRINIKHNLRVYSLAEIAVLHTHYSCARGYPLRALDDSVLFDLVCDLYSLQSLENRTRFTRYLLKYLLCTHVRKTKPHE